MEERIPVVKLPFVTHVGASELVPRTRPARNGSQEGGMLSVSVTPASWTMIAKLGGGAWTELSRPNAPLVFLDFYKMSSALKKRMANDAVDAGLAKRSMMWRAWDTNEDGEAIYSLHETEDEAALNSGDPEVAPPTPDSVVAGTRRLAVHWGSEPSPFGTMSALASLAFAGTGLDGIWWHEDYDPWALSAPRGGIFQHKIPDLIQKPVPDRGRCYEDDPVVRRGAVRVVLPDSLFAVCDAACPNAGMGHASLATGQKNCENKNVFF